MRSTDLLDSRLSPILIALLLAIVASGVVDLALDRPARLWSFHVLFEVGFILLCLGVAIGLWRAGVASTRSLARTRAALAAREQELGEWRGRARRLLEGLGLEIDRQMQAWGLSPAEREVALLLIKGYSTREIATHLDKSERTVRQQCSAVYRRSGLRGRAELSAFFLEDLLLPSQEGGRW